MAAPPLTNPVAGTFPPLTPPPQRAAERPAAESDSRDAHASRAEVVVAVATVVGLTALLLLPALFNRYPVLFADTSDYLRRAQSLTPSPIRAPGYAIWLRLTGVNATLWLPVIAQALVIAALIWRTLRAFGTPGLAATLAAGLALVLGSSAGWASSRVMPDVFIAAAILGLYLIVVHWNRLGAVARGCVGTAIVVAGTMHLTNILVGAAVLVAMLVIQRSSGGRRWSRPEYLRAALLIVLSAAMTRTWEALRRDESEPGWNGNIFVLSHLVETGLAQQVLEERCGVEQFALCPVRDTLTRSVEVFVWRANRGPRYLVLHDDPTLIHDETNHILRTVVARHPLALGVSIFRYTAEQFATFRVNDEIWRHPKPMHVQRAIAAVAPGDTAAERVSRQQRNTLRLPWTTLLHLFVFFGSAAFSLVMLRRTIAAGEFRLDRAAGFHAMVWSALLVNAAICANLASVFSRYQSRVSWLLPFAVIVTLAERGRLRWPPTAPRLTVDG